MTWLRWRINYCDSFQHKLVRVVRARRRKSMLMRTTPDCSWRTVRCCASRARSFIAFALFCGRASWLFAASTTAGIVFSICCFLGFILQRVGFLSSLGKEIRGLGDRVKLDLSLASGRLQSASWQQEDRDPGLITITSSSCC